MFSFFEWKRSEVLFVGGILLLILLVSRAQLKIGQMKARDAQRKADVELVGRALEKYYHDYEIYPSGNDGQIVACGDLADLPCKWGKDGIHDIEGVVYLKLLPNDPLAHDEQKYIYEVDATQKKYRIYVALEYRRDVDWKQNLTSGCGNGLQCNWYVENP